jgi:hypothetical protein
MTGQASYRLHLKFSQYRNDKNVMQISARIPRTANHELTEAHDRIHMKSAKKSGDFIAIAHASFEDQIRKNLSIPYSCDLKIHPNRPGLIIAVPIEATPSDKIVWETSEVDPNGRLVQRAKNVFPKMFRSQPTNAEYEVNHHQRQILAVLKSDNFETTVVAYTDDDNALNSTLSVHPLHYFSAIRNTMRLRGKLVRKEAKPWRVKNLDDVVIREVKYSNTTIYRWIPKHFSDMYAAALSDPLKEFSSADPTVSKAWLVQAFLSEEAMDQFEARYNVPKSELAAYAIGEWFFTLPPVKQEAVAEIPAAPVTESEVTDAAA